jgi:cysteinyl-tRNA synthetase
VSEFADRVAAAEGGTSAMVEIADRAEAEFREALFDDLGAPEAQAALFTFLKAVNRELDRNGGDVAGLARARKAFESMNAVLDIVPERAEASADLSAWVEERIVARRAARDRRDFAEADRIRAELAARGVALEDAAGGTKWKIVKPG